MRKLFMLSLLASASLFMFSCKDDDEVKPDVTIPDKFSDLTPEQHKAKLEENGLQLIEDMEGLKDLNAIEAIINFVDLMSDDEDVYYTKDLFNAITVLDKNAASTEIFSAMRVKEGDGSIQEMYEAEIGVYTWNPTFEEWDYQETGSAIVYKFPANAEENTNNATLTIKDYKGVTVANPLDADYSGDLPTNLVVELKIDATVVMKYSFNAQYNNEGIPSLAKSTLELSPYVYAVEATNNSKEISLNYSLKKSAKVLIALGSKAGGLFDEDNLENGEEISDVFHTAEAYFQVMNIKIAGTVDIKKLEAETLNLDGPSQQMVKAFNDYVDLAVIYADSNEKLAEIDFYLGTYGDLDARMVFGDGSKTNLEVYFNNGFDDLLAEIEDLLSEFEEEEVY